MNLSRFIRIAPGGSPIPGRVLAAIAFEHDPVRALTEALGERFPDHAPTYHASGREAMRDAFARLAARSGRSEIALPAYCCYSLPASVVAAGLKVRLVDVDERGRLSVESLDAVDLGRVAAIVVANLFGVPESIAPIQERARAAGVAVIDDAAQSIGATTREGAVGSRGDLGVLSFGRGKPVSAMGGGALLWRKDAVESPPARLPRPGGSQRVQALLRAIAYDAARHPVALRLLATIPALEIGTTVYDPGFARGAMPAFVPCLAAPLLRELDRMTTAHRERAESLALRIRSTSAFEPSLATEGDRGTYPRLALIAPAPELRDRALARLVAFGASGMYPESLGAIEALEPHLVGSRSCPGARRFARCVLTLPTHAGLHAGAVDVILGTLHSPPAAAPSGRTALRSAGPNA